MEKKFRIISIVFIIGCIIFYGARFGYYYMKFNKKSTSNSNKVLLSEKILSEKIVKKGDGLYNNSGEAVYKGTSVNNYLMYSNIMFRIVKVNSDNTVTLVTDSKLTDLAYSNNSDYLNSYIVEWLNKDSENTGIFENMLNDPYKYLVKGTICLDDVTDIKNITCHKKDNSNYINILSIADYLNSKNEKSYIDNTNNIWLYNSYDEATAWYVTKGNLSKTSKDNIFGIKAVITLKNNVEVISGDGSKENPYIIEKQNNLVGFNSYIKLGDDLYTVIEKGENTIKLVSDKLVSDSISRSANYYNKEFNPKDYYTTAYYLNNKYFNSLTYKNNLVDCNFNIGDYSSDTNYDYKNIYTKNVEAKVGMLSVADINVNNKLNNYFLLNKIGNKRLIVNNTDEGVYSISNIRPVVCISSNTKLKGSGTLNSPFELEVQNEN